MTLDPVLVLTAQLGLGALFAVAVVHKLRAPREFQATVFEYRVLPEILVPLGAALIIVFEAATAIMLLARVLPRPGALLAAMLLATYASVIGLNLARGRRDVDCGCAGPAARQPLSEWLLVRNAVLFAGALVAAATPTARAWVWLDAVTVAFSLIGAALIYAALNLALAHAPKLETLRG